MTKKVTDLDSVRFKKSVEKTAQKIKKPEDVKVKIHERYIAKPGRCAISFGFSLEPNNDVEKPKKTDK